jgi:hypothetical protein
MTRPQNLVALAAISIAVAALMTRLIVSAPSASSATDVTEAAVQQHAGPMDAVACVQPLSDFCASHACSPLPQALADSVARRPSGFECQTGRCGQGRFITVQHAGFSGETRYFDRDGTLVSVREWADANWFCDKTSFAVTYGVDPSCSEETRERCSDDGGPSSLALCQAACEGNLLCLLRCSSPEGGKASALE